MRVSVLMITYNHERYIEKAIEGVLSQQTKFDFELIIGNDASKDNSHSIITTFLKDNKLSNRVKYFNHDENLGIQDNFKFVYSKANCEYVAICEGDDYWTDPLKLQKQIDFLEANKNYSLCYTRFETFNERTKTLSLDLNEKHFTNNNSSIDFTFEKFQKGWHIGTQTLVYRRSFLNFKDTEKYRYFRDVHVVTELLKKGKGACLNFVGAVYRIHDGGIHSSVTFYNGYKMSYYCYKEIFINNKENIYLRRKYLNSFQNFINANIKEEYYFKAFWMSIKLYLLQYSFLALFSNLKHILFKRFKIKK